MAAIHLTVGGSFDTAVVHGMIEHCQLHMSSASLGAQEEVIQSEGLIPITRQFQQKSLGGSNYLVPHSVCIGVVVLLPSKASIKLHGPMKYLLFKAKILTWT